MHSALWLIGGPVVVDGYTSPTSKAVFMDSTMEILSTAMLSRSTTVRLRPRYEGNNICTWIGFKHVNYLVEEAVLEHFRAAGLSSRRLFEEFGLGLDVVDLDTQIRTAFHLDDVGVARVEPIDADGLSFTVIIDREGHAPGRAVVAKVRVVLRRETYVDPTDNVPVELAPFTVDTIGDGHGAGVAATTEGDPALEQLIAGRNAFGWRQRIAYPYCHFNERLQMSGYLRQMEAAADLFLADRGISIRQMLDTRRWIPVVPHSRIRILAEALMEEDLYTVYAVDEVFKALTYRSTMDTYVVSWCSWSCRCGCRPGWCAGLLVRPAGGVLVRRGRLRRGHRGVRGAHRRIPGRHVDRLATTPGHPATTGTTWPSLGKAGAAGSVGTARPSRTGAPPTSASSTYRTHRVTTAAPPFTSRSRRRGYRDQPRPSPAARAVLPAGPPVRRPPARTGRHATTPKPRPARTSRRIRPKAQVRLVRGLSTGMPKASNGHRVHSTGLSKQPIACYSTRKFAIIAMSSCSRLWQWSMYRPG